MTRIGLVVLAALAFASARGAAAQVRMPVEINRDGMMIVQVAGSGDSAASFVIDLGAGTEVLSGRYGKRVTLGTAGFFSSFRSTGARVDVERVRITPMALGPVATPPDAVVWHGLDSLGIDGLISARTFARAPVTLDFGARQLVFETPASLAARARHGTVLPLGMDDVRGVALDLFLEFDFGNGQRGTCEIDTGSQAIDLSVRYLAAFGISGDSAAAMNYRGQLPTTVAPVGAPELTLERPRVRFGDYIYDCVIGTSFWANTALTLDIPHHRIILAAVEPR